MVHSACPEVFKHLHIFFYMNAFGMTCGHTAALQHAHWHSHSAGGLGAVGSLLSLWISELQEGTHLWLLGRSGRGSWDPHSVGDCLVTLARSDVSVLEETDFVVNAAGLHSPLQVRHRCKILTKRLIIMHGLRFSWEVLP